MTEKLSQDVLKRSFTVDLLAILFGIGTWIGINGVFIQLPLLVDEAPEGWSLPSYLSVCVQIGNIGPIAYTLARRFAKNNNDGYTIYGMLILGTISALLSAFFYNRTATLLGSQHSVALFVLTIFTAINACTSSVLFMPYMGRFREIYMVTYFIGEGLSGLLPSGLALVQGIGGQAECRLQNVTESGEEVYEQYIPPPRFGTSTFFIVIFAMMLCSCIAFTLLDRLKLARKQYAVVHDEIKMDNENRVVAHVAPDEAVAPASPFITVFQYRYLMALVCILSFFSLGVLNSIQVYSCRPYGIIVYHLAATLSVSANPVACFLAIFVPHTSLRSILTLSGISSVLLAYVMVTAIVRPQPPFSGSSAGGVIIVISWTLLIGLVSYIKLSIAAVMRIHGGNSLLWTGGFTQLGAAFGSVFIFVLINFTHIFQVSEDEIVC